MLKCSIFLKSNILSARIPNNFANNIDFFVLHIFAQCARAGHKKLEDLKYVVRTMRGHLWKRGGGFGG